MGNEQAILLDCEPRVHRITVEEVLALDETGFFEGVERVELIEGEIIETAPLFRPRARTLMELTIAVGVAVRDLPGLEGLTPVSAKLDPHRLTETDIVIAAVANDDSERFVQADEMRLMVEVSASALGHDLGRKLRLYARTGVPEYRVADMNGRVVIRFHDPAGETYRQRAEFAFGEAVPAATIAGLTVDTARLA